MSVARNELSAHQAIRQLPLYILPADKQAVFSAVHMKTSHTLFYADDFAVVFAIHDNAAVVTSDPAFEAVASLVTLESLKE